MTLVLSTVSNSFAYVDDFSSTEYRDNLNTTAWWDTVGGSLKLNLDMQLIGSVSIDQPRNSVLDGDYMFVLDYSYGLRVIDISNPSSLVEVGSAGSSVSGCYDIDKSGNYVYVATDAGGPQSYSGGLEVFDVSDPTNPSHVTYFNIPYYEVVGIDVDGNYAYVVTGTGDGSGGVEVVDISDPTNPTSVGSVATPGHSQRIAVSGDYAYVTDSDSGMAVIDVSDPANPARLLNYNPHNDDYRRIALSGDYAYLYSYSNGFAVFDISNPSSPVSVYSEQNKFYGSISCIKGNYAYSCSESGMEVIDISDPTSPVSIGLFSTPSGMGVKCICVDGENAYLSYAADAYNGSVEVVKVREVASPMTLTNNSSFSTSALKQMVIDGDYMFVLDYSYGLRVIDISNPSSPVEVGSAGSSVSGCYEIDKSGNYIYVATDAGGPQSYSGGLEVFDVSDPTNPSHVTYLNIPNYEVIGIDVDGNYAYVTTGTGDGSGGVEVIDISDPTNPASVGSVTTPGHGQRIAVSGDYAYIADCDSGMAVIDVSDPANPSHLLNYNPYNEDYRHISLSGKYVYLSSDGNALSVINVIDPTNPVAEDKLAFPTGVTKAVNEGNRLFVCSANGSKIYGINKTDPTTLSVVDSLEVAGANMMYVSNDGDYLFCTDLYGYLYTCRVFNHEMDETNNIGRSLVVNSTDEDILGVRLTSSQEETVDWTISADSGSTWQSINNDWDWVTLDNPGNRLMWKAALSASEGIYSPDNVYPSCSSLEMGYMYNYASIDSILDVPGDQGGWVRIFFTRSGYDYDGSPNPISGYNIYREIEDVALAASIREDGIVVSDERMFLSSSESGEKEIPFTSADFDLVKYNDTYYVIVGDGPEGMWEVVASFYTNQEDNQVALVPTLVDSTEAGIAYSTFYISAHTTNPSVFYASSPDSGYSVDNIAPSAPMGIAMTEGSILNWDDNTENDLDGYEIYGRKTFDGPNDALDRVYSSEYDVTSTIIEGYHFWSVAAVDCHGNRSLLAEPAQPTPSDDIPMVSSLSQNYPNPFNPQTRISFTIKERGQVTMGIYDVSGRCLRVLLDSEMEKGSHSVMWNGTDGRGNPVASGVYFYRIESGNFRDTKKMVLLR